MEIKKNSESRFRMSCEPTVPSEKAPWNSQFLTERETEDPKALTGILTNLLRDEVPSSPSSCVPYGNPCGLPPAPRGLMSISTC